MATSHAPDGYHTVTPYLRCADVAAALAFIEQVFDGTVSECIKDKEGAINHAEIQVGDSKVMLGPRAQDAAAMPGMLYIYVADTDATYKKALEAGASSVMEPRAAFYGDRNGAVEDPAGHQWWIATRVETLSQQELQERALEARG